MMTPTNSIKKAESAKIVQDLKAYKRQGGKIEILPAPGSGHQLRSTYDIRHAADVEAKSRKKGAFRIKEKAE